MKPYEILEATITGVGPATEDPENKVFVVISWAAKDIGFGEMTIVQHKEGGPAAIDGETMSKDFCKAVLAKLIDEAEFIG